MKGGSGPEIENRSLGRDVPTEKKTEKSKERRRLGDKETTAVQARGERGAKKLRLLGYWRRKFLLHPCLWRTE